VIRSEICGAVKMKVYLTGMPELRLGLNDKILFENTGSKECCIDMCDPILLCATKSLIGTSLEYKNSTLGWSHTALGLVSHPHVYFLMVYLYSVLTT